MIIFSQSKLNLIDWKLKSSKSIIHRSSKNNNGPTSHKLFGYFIDSQNNISRKTISHQGTKNIFGNNGNINTVNISTKAFLFIFRPVFDSISRHSQQLFPSQDILAPSQAPREPCYSQPPAPPDHPRVVVPQLP